MLSISLEWISLPLCGLGELSDQDIFSDASTALPSQHADWLLQGAQEEPVHTCLQFALHLIAGWMCAVVGCGRASAEQLPEGPLLPAGCGRGLAL